MAEGRPLSSGSHSTAAASYGCPERVAEEGLRRITQPRVRAPLGPCPAGRALAARRTATLERAVSPV